MSEWYIEFKPWPENQIECIVIWKGNWPHQSQRPNSAGFGMTEEEAFGDVMKKLRERYPGISVTTPAMNEKRIER